MVIDLNKFDKFLFPVIMIACTGNLTDELHLSISSFGIFQLIQLFAFSYYSYRLVTNLGADVGSFHLLSLILFLTICFYVSCSIFWSSINFSLVVKYVVLVLMIVSSCYVAGRYSIEELVNSSLPWLIMFLIFNIAVVLFVPSIGLDRLFHIGAWEGIYIQKNVLGRFSLLLSLFLLVSFISRKINLLTYIFLFIITAFVCFKTQSRTSLLLLVLIPLLYLGVRFIFKYRILSGVLISLPFLVYIFIENASFGNIYSANDYVEIFGLQIHLTGRPTIWNYIFERLSFFDNWIFGFGFDGFWDRNVDEVIIPGMGAVQSSDALNGYIDMIVQFGYVGLALLTAFLYICLFRINDVPGGFEREYVLLFFIFILVSNLTESYFFKSTNIMSFLMFYLAFKVMRECNGK